MKGKPRAGAEDTQWPPDSGPDACSPKAQVFSEWISQQSTVLVSYGKTKRELGSDAMTLPLSVRHLLPGTDLQTPLAHCLHQSSERLQEVQSPAWLPLSHCSELNCPWYLPWWWKCSRSMLTNGHMWQASSHPKLSGSEHPTPPCNNGLSPPHHWSLQESPGYNCFPSTPFPLRNTLLWMSSYMISLNLTNSGVIPSQVINFLCSTASPNIFDFRFCLELPRAD